MPSTEALLVVAGEASGDEWAAPTVRELDVSAFGLGGSHLAEAGCDLLDHVSEVSAIGFGPALLRVPRLTSLGTRLLRAAKKRSTRAALLVGYSEFNGWLGPRLRAMGLRVLWFAPPQVWAWRPGRARRYAKACDRMALVLPFEQRFWQRVGVDAHFVGHPATTEPVEPKDKAQQRLGIRPGDLNLALLPGSRTSEVTRHLGLMLEAATRLRIRHGARAWVVLADDLPAASVQRVRERAARAGVGCLEPGSDRLLSAFDAALVKSGTASLKCALAGVASVIVYRTNRLTELLLRRLLCVSSIGLPNLLLGRRDFPELVGCRLTAAETARELEQLLPQTERVAQAQRQLWSLLEPPSLRSTEGPPTRRVARLIRPWLA